MSLHNDVTLLVEKGLGAWAGVRNGQESAKCSSLSSSVQKGLFKGKRSIYQALRAGSLTRQE